MRVATVPKLVGLAARNWSNDNAARLGAALSYYTLFAIPPLFVILIYIASLCLDERTVKADLFQQVGGVVGKKAAEAIQSAMTVANSPTKGLIASCLAILTLVLSATGLFLELQGALNAIWGVREKPGQGVGAFLKNRFLSFTLVVSTGLLLILSLVVSTVIAGAGKYMSNLAPALDALWNLGNLAVSFAVLTVLFALIFKILPDVRITWRDVWVGAAMTALLFTLGKLGLGLYLGKNSSVSAYGAAGSVVLLLLWVYYSAQILFFGAELTRVYANHCGTRFVPKQHAEWAVPPAPAPVAAPQAQPIQSRGPKTKRAKMFSELQQEIAALDELVKRKRRAA
jgi:membrane protein